MASRHGYVSGAYGNASNANSNSTSYGYGYGATGTGTGTASGSGTSTPPREPGARRKKFASLAGSVYRAGVAAASEIKDQYNNTRIRGVETTEGVSIPGSFPEVAIVHRGGEQMVLFPSYAKRHVKGQGLGTETIQREGADEEEYWRMEWERREDERAVVDVDVRGWIYMPSKGPMTRRNRMVIGLARRLSGIPAPYAQQQGQQMMGETEEERRIAREAREIERRGRGEREVGSRGGYSEKPGGDEEEEEGDRERMVSSAPGSPVLGPRHAVSMAPVNEMSEAELAVANANLMARIGPFMTTPLVQLPITLFFYNDEQSQSRTVTTNDSGHFYVRAALDFVPTHVRVLANENISVVEPVRIIESTGVSLISDIDDTIKRSSIGLGAREIFRNTFIRDLGDLTIEGVREWYHTLHGMGVQFHYCSNSPWQLFPVLATYFLTAGLPPGSIHLKHYAGMLQGIFEPVAERKKGTLEKILRDFPERKFLLVGDSGEADLEVYTELAVANPGRILAVFIRDVTTPDQLGYFDTSLSGPLRQQTRQDIRTKSDGTGGDEPARRPSLPPRVRSEPSNGGRGPATGMLIDLSEEPQQTTPSESDLSSRPKANAASNLDLLSKKPPPPRPTKPAALRSTPSDLGRAARASSGSNSVGSHTVSRIQRSLEGSPASSPGPPSSASNGSRATPPPPPPPPPPPRRRGTSALSNVNSDAGDLELPPAAANPPSAATITEGTQEPVNKKLDLWRRRLARAHEILDEQGVQLYTWRKGDDVIKEAEGIVRQAIGR
ncbi:hypothetical protein OQA88_79 [Cercophora sp. LCS_1]